MTDWRLPENRREAFQRFYSFHLKYRTHPGCVYFLLPELAKHYNLDDDGKAWLVWLNGNTQNPVTTQLLLEASDGRPEEWERAVAFWQDNWDRLQWDIDRRYQKGKFAEATASWVRGVLDYGPAQMWKDAGKDGWVSTWGYAFNHPYMGRLSAWSMTEYAKILFPTVVPDADSLLLWDSASVSHRNGLTILAGWGDPYRKWDKLDLEVYVPELEELGTDLLREAQQRNLDSQDVTRLTLESALCTYKSWHKPNRRYPNVYADMHLARIEWAEKHWGSAVKLQREARARHLPKYLRLEDNPADPGMAPEKQNHYLNTGEVIMMHREWPDMDNAFNQKIEGR